VIAHPDGQCVVGHARRHIDRRAERRVLRGVLEQMGQGRGGQPRIDPHRHIGIERKVDVAALQGLLDVIACGGHDLGGMCPPRLGGNRPGVDARHLEDVLEQARQPLDFRPDHLALLEPLLTGQFGLTEIARCHPNRGQRRPQIVAQRRQQGRLELLALARQLAGLALLQQLGALESDGHYPRQRIQRPRLDGPTRGGEHANRLRPDT